MTSNLAGGEMQEGLEAGKVDAGLFCLLTPAAEGSLSVIMVCSIRSNQKGGYEKTSREDFLPKINLSIDLKV